MVLDIFIFLVPLVISLFIYFLSFHFKYDKIWGYLTFTISFIFIFTTAYMQSSHIDAFEIKEEVKELISNGGYSILETDLPHLLSNKHKNSIVGYTYSKEKQGTQDVVKISYNEELFNGVILLQNKFYITK